MYENPHQTNFFEKRASPGRVSKKKEIEELDVVALQKDRNDLGLVKGQVGTVVEILGPGHYEVEFVDDNGNTYAMTPLPANELLVLHYRPVAA
jgi:hypothetical protein